MLILMVNISLLIGWIYSWWISHCWLVEHTHGEYLTVDWLSILMVNISLLIGWDQYTMYYVDTHGEYLTVDWLGSIYNVICWCPVWKCNFFCNLCVRRKAMLYFIFVFIIPKIILIKEFNQTFILPVIHFTKILNNICKSCHPFCFLFCFCCFSLFTEG
jgi:hypothetical protein